MNIGIKKKLGVVIVNYKSTDETINYCLHELSKIKTNNILVIVNNEATESCNRELSEALDAPIIEDISLPINKYRKVFILSAKENLGYAKGNNFGTFFLEKHFPEIDYLLFSNNDLKFIDDKVVDLLLEKMATIKDIAVIGPKIVGLDNKDQSPYRSMSIWKMLILPKLIPIWGIFFRLNIAKTEVIQRANEGYYYRLLGAFLMVRKASFLEINGFDPNTFLFAEELILSEKILSIGMKSYFFPQTVVLHNHGEVIKKYLSYKKISQIAFESLFYYYKFYRNVPRYVLLVAKFASFIDKYFYIHRYFF